MGPGPARPPLALAEPARHAGRSVRTPSRRFRDEVGMTPGQWLTRRMQLARRLLEAADLPVDRIAEEAGLGTGASLRRHVALTIGVAPPAYRQAFRAKATGGTGG
ncbi:helix-turn-helix domain-containing protein [Streptomyces sp. NPDC007369]|uniref:helix-turn-helix domain-containing protein n=1 Tax=Streptomyces sp. NPDC007369 TaxID=3154589 RepID=UPI0033EACDB9